MILLKKRSSPVLEKCHNSQTPLVVYTYINSSTNLEAIHDCSYAGKMRLLLLRLPVGRGGVINSPRFWFFFSVSKVGAPLMGDTAVHSLSHDFKLNF